ncbi:MAG: SDR family NAD(P)-dependent oxidoreductase [Alphaproteobacteria bacterium]
MIGKFDQKTVVITGGASGIGRACADAFARQGAVVVIADINHEAACETAHELNGHAFELDVRDEHAVIAFAQQVEQEFKNVDVLVASAGIVQPPHRPEEFPMALFDDVLNINFRGCFLTMREMVRLMPSGSSIVSISSITAERSMPLHAYAPQKAALSNLTMGLAAEWGPKGIRVNAVQPGFTKTPAIQKQIELGHRDPELLERNSTLGRMVEPEEIASAVCFLSSSDAAAITGVSLPVDAGFLCAGSWFAYGGLR